jgi:hypothetical protein
MAAFDPYHHWLGIPPEEQPPNHYRLLGINAFETSISAIKNAADQRRDFLKSVQTGEHVQFSQDLLNQVGQAKSCLLDPDKRLAYNALLRQQQAETNSPVQTSPLAPPLSVPVPPVQEGRQPYPTTPSKPVLTDNSSRSQSTYFGPTTTTRFRRYKFRLVSGHRNRFRFIFTGFSLGISLTLLLAVVVLFRSNWRADLTSVANQNRTAMPSSEVGHPKTKPPSSPQVNSTKPDLTKPTIITGAADRATDGLPNTAPHPESHRQLKVEPGAIRSRQELASDRKSLTSQQRSELAGHLAAARTALTNRQLDVADEQLQLARELAASSEFEPMAERLHTLQHYVQEFWLAVENGMLNLNDGGELMLASGEPAFVVEVTSEEITIRDQGKNKLYKKMELPGNLVLAIAKHWLDEDNLANKLVGGAFMAVDPAFDTGEAVGIWRNIAENGANVPDDVIDNVADLLDCLADSYDDLVK